MTTFLSAEKVDQPENRCIVRIRTSCWSDARGLHVKKDITFQHRLSTGMHLIQEDVGAIGADEVVSRIVDLDKYDHGFYEVVACNIKRDWESGCVDEYDYKLIPYSD